MDKIGAGPNITSIADDLLCSLLRGDAPEWPTATNDEFEAVFIDRAQYHGVLSLVHDRFQRAPNLGKAWPSSVTSSCRNAAIPRAMWELRHRHLLQRVLAALASQGVQPVLFKGTALAYSHYSESALRTRGDTDLIIAPDALTQTAPALADHGFQRQAGTNGEFVSYQASYVHAADGGNAHALDVHWRINNAEVLANLFTYAELLDRSRALPGLSSDARAASPVDALLIACMHRATHKQNPYYVDGIPYYEGDRLIWLYDIHLLVVQFGTREWADFLFLAESKGLCAVCLEGLERAATAFQSQVPEIVRTQLACAGHGERVARYFAASALRQQWMNFGAIPGALPKVRFVLQTFFPSTSYMRHKYPEGGWLPRLYFKRAAAGILRRLLNRRLRL